MHEHTNSSKSMLTNTSLIHYAEIDGVPVRYLKAGKGNTLLLIHTLRTQLDYFEEVLIPLTEQYEVYAVDLPGSGRSGLKKGIDYTEEYFRKFLQGFINSLDLKHVTILGESMGGTLALTLASRNDQNRIERVFAFNPYDYGRGGGIKRSSFLANIVFTAMKWPILGYIVSHTENKWILRKILKGGLYHKDHLKEQLIDTLLQSGRRKFHAGVFRSVIRNWKTWIKARNLYPDIKVPVVLVYGDSDWSLPAEREENRKAIRSSVMLTLERTSHFSCLDEPGQVINIIKSPPAIINQ